VAVALGGKTVAVGARTDEARGAIVAVAPGSTTAAVGAGAGEAFGAVVAVASGGTTVTAGAETGEEGVAARPVRRGASTETEQDRHILLNFHTTVTAEQCGHSISAKPGGLGVWREGTAAIVAVPAPGIVPFPEIIPAGEGKGEGGIKQRTRTGEDKKAAAGADLFLARKGSP
jgi:hypothetical protein